MLLVSAGALALTALVGVAFIAGVHVSPAVPPDGVVGWATIHHYSKRQELLSYAFVLAVAAAAGWGAAAIDARIRRRDPSARGALLRIAAAAPLLICAVALGVQQTPPPAYADALIGIAGAAAVLVVAMRLRPNPNSPVATATALPPLETPDRDTVFGIAAALGAVALFATIAGWMLAVLLPAGAPGADLLRFIVPLATLGALFLAVRRGAPLAVAAGFGALASAPLVLLIFIPVVSGAAAAGLVIVVAALVLAVWRHPRATRLGSDARVAGVVAAVALVTAAALSAWAHNPRFLAGAFIGPLDGDALLSWLYEGTRGRVVFRDFWYPYGPLNYATQYAGVALGGLDRYDAGTLIIQWAISAACAALVVGALFGRRLLTVLAAPFLFLASLPEPRVWVGFAGLVLALWALRNRSRRAGAAAGILLGLQGLWSIEVFASAGVALAVSVGFLVWRDGAARVRDPALAAISGALLAVLAVGAAVGLATGSLGAFIAGTTRFIGVVDACCAQAFPSVFGGLNSQGGAPNFALEPRFLGYYLVPGVYAAAIVALAARARASLRLEDGDVVLGGVTLFGAILFRAVLARTDAGHLAFVSVPAAAVALLLVHRALAIRNIRPLGAAVAVLLLILWPARARPRSGAWSKSIATCRRCRWRSAPSGAIRPSAGRRSPLRMETGSGSKPPTRRIPATSWRGCAPTPDPRTPSTQCRTPRATRCCSTARRRPHSDRRCGAAS